MNTQADNPASGGTSPAAQHKRRSFPLYAPMAHPERDLNFYCPLRPDCKLGRVVVLEGRAVYDCAVELTARGWAWRKVDGQGTGSRQPACLVMQAAYLANPVTKPQRDRLLLVYLENSRGVSREEIARVTRLVNGHDAAERALLRQRREDRATRHGQAGLRDWQRRAENRRRQIEKDEQDYRRALASLVSGSQPAKEGL